MIKFPDLSGVPDNVDPFAGSRFDDWLSAGNIYDLLDESCRKHASRIALTWITTGERDEKPRKVTYADLINQVSRAANVFRSLNVARRNVVAYMLPALPETQYVLWGAETAGIACPINYLLQTAHIAELVRAAEAKVLVAYGPSAGSDIWQKAVDVQRLVPGLVLVKVLGDEVAANSCVDFAAACLAESTDLAFADRPSPTDIAAYFHTGGTTGLPKLVTHTHRNQLVAAYGGAAAAHLSPSDVITNGFPMFHVAGTIFCSLSQLLAGAGILIMSADGFRNGAMIKNFWQIVQKYGVTIAGAVPTALAAILEQNPNEADLSSLRVVMSGAASLPLSVAERAEQITGKPVHEILGMTESGGIVATEAAWHERVLGSVGYPVPFVQLEARKLRQDGTLGIRCEPEEVGVFVIKGENVTPGYKNRAHDVNAYTEDGWLVSGDLGYLDHTGRVFITGRDKDLIIRSGHNIDPAMIEAAFLAHEAVAAAAAVAMPDAYAGELPVAFVVLKTGRDVSTEALQTFVESRIHERPAYPKKIYFVDRLPTTGVGKVFKPALRNSCAAQVFLDVLRDEPLRSLAVNEKAKRGREVEIMLKTSPQKRMGIRSRIEKKLAPYLVTISWL